jgi:hypothetical protein
MSEQNPLQVVMQNITQNNFAAAKDHIHGALYGKARELVNIKRQEMAATLVNQEIDDGEETRSRQG